MTLLESTARSKRHYEMMLPWLPERCEHFLDIGCGHGGIASQIAGHYPASVAHLLDGAEQTEKWVSWRENGEPWASVHLAVELLSKDHPGRASVAWTPDTVKELPMNAFDVVYSVCSWGHHYGIEQYLEIVAHSMRPGATLIVDLRLGEIGEQGEALLRSKFVPVSLQVYVGKKYRRTVWKKKDDLDIH